MQKQLVETPAGGEFTVGVDRSEDYAYLRADTISAMTLPMGDVEMALLQFRGKILTQTFKVVDAGENEKTIQSGVMETDSDMIEGGRVRFSMQIAVDAAAVLLEQALKSGYPMAFVRQRFATIPLFFQEDAAS